MYQWLLHPPPLICCPTKLNLICSWAATSLCPTVKSHSAFPMTAILPAVLIAEKKQVPLTWLVCLYLIISFYVPLPRKEVPCKTCFCSFLCSCGSCFPFFVIIKIQESTYPCSVVHFACFLEGPKSDWSFNIWWLHVIVQCNLLKRISMCQGRTDLPPPQAYY